MVRNQCYGKCIIKWNNVCRCVINTDVNILLELLGNVLVYIRLS